MEDEKIVDSESVNDTAVESSEPQSAQKEKKRINKKLVYLFSIVGLSAFFCAFYYSSMNFPGYFFPVVMFSYLTVLTVLIFVYIIYNRGFSRKGVTEEMLPMDWTPEQKREFIESGEKRLQKSKWILVFIISIFFTFVVEVFVLFIF